MPLCILPLQSCDVGIRAFQFGHGQRTLFQPHAVDAPHHVMPVGAEFQKIEEQSCNDGNARPDSDGEPYHARKVGKPTDKRGCKCRRGTEHQPVYGA